MIKNLISVIIPTYNWSSVLKLAIKTALWQTYKNIEVIVVGDCCTDDSEEVVKSFNDPRLKWINLEKNHGSQAIPNNFGIKIAQGEFIAHLGHDDVWHPKHLEHLINSISNAKFAHSLCLAIGPEDEESVFKNLKIISGFNVFDNKDNEILFVPPSSWMYRTSVIEKVGYWLDHNDTILPPDAYFLTKIQEHFPNETACSKKLTIAKFPSAWRRNSYIIKPTHDQEKVIDLIEKNFHYLDLYMLKYLEQNSKLVKFIPFMDLYADKSYEVLSLFFKENVPQSQVIKENEKEKGMGVKKSRIYRGLEKS